MKGERVCEGEKVNIVEDIEMNGLTDCKKKHNI